LSQKTAQEFAGQGASGVEVLYPPIDLAGFRQPHVGGPFPAPYVFGAGRLDDPRKDFPFLIRAVEIARKRIPSLSLVLGGAVEPNSQVSAFGRARLGEAFIATGNLSGRELAHAYAGASVFALTSRQEGLGIVVAEAMASGTPTVQRRCGGADELVDEGQTGFLLEDDDLDGFAARVVELVADDDAARRMGENARRRAVRLFSPETFTRTLLDAHRWVFPGLVAEADEPASGRAPGLETT
jgi:glycosyltransferase involved in cell wall biosynthesis